MRDRGGAGWKGEVVVVVEMMTRRMKTALRCLSTKRQGEIIQGPRMAIMLGRQIASEKMKKIAYVAAKGDFLR